MPTAEEASRELTEKLRSSEELLMSMTAAGGETRQLIALDEDQLGSLRRRIDTLEEDRRRYRDAITLRDLGSDEVAILEGGECPASHRPLPEALVVPEPLSHQEETVLWALFEDGTPTRAEVRHPDRLGHDEPLVRSSRAASCRLTW